jgi:hypothetical protein
MIVDYICSMDVSDAFSIGGEDKGFSTLPGSDRDPCAETAVNLLPLLRHIWWKR